MRKFTQFTLMLLAMFMVTLNANAWKFTLSEPAVGTVEELKDIFLSYPGNMMDEWPCPSMQVVDEKGNTYDFSYNDMGYKASYVNGSITEPGTYTLHIAAGTYHVGGAANEEQTFTWTIGSSQGGGSTVTVELTGESFEFFNISEIEFADFNEKNNGKDVGTFEKYGFSMTAAQGSSNMFVPRYNYNQSFKGLVAYNGNNITITSQSHPILGVEFVLAEGEKSFSVTEGVYAGGKWQAPATHAVTSATFSFKDRAVIEKIIVYTDEDVTEVNPPAETPSFELNYDKNESALILTWPQGTTVAIGTASATLEGYSGEFTLFENEENSLVAYLDLPNGDYTLNVPENAFIVNNQPMAATTYPFTVSSSITGNAWNETIFSSTTWASKADAPDPIVINTNAVQMTTVGTTFMGEPMNIDFDTYETKELNWKANTQLVFVPMGDNTITKIIIVPTADSKTSLQNASATLGTYTNGVWTGELNATASLSLTAGEGINISKIVVCYNGDEGEGTTDEDNKPGTITVQWPVENQGINRITDGGVLAKFTTDKYYDQVTVELRNVNSNYHNLYDLPVRYMDKLQPGEHTCTTSTPGTSDTGGNPAWVAYNGDAYELVIKGYASYWDTDYDAMVVVPVRGESSKEHEIMSNLNLVKITPETATELNMGAPRAQVTMARDNVITFEFSGALSSLSAVRPGSLIGGISELPLVSAPVEGSDNKIWTVTIPQTELYDNYNPGEDYNFEISAKDTEGHSLALNERRADNKLAIVLTIVENDIDPDVVRSLGTPAFSIATGSQNVNPATSSIKVTFPEASGFEGNVVAKITGSLATMNQTAPVTFENVQGTLANGVEVPVQLEEETNYMFTITSVDLSEQTVVEQETFINPIGSYSGNWSTQFSTTGTEIIVDLMGEAAFSADAAGITISWPNAKLSSIQEGQLAINNIEIYVNGDEFNVSPDALQDLSGDIKIQIPYEKIAVWDETIGDWGGYVPVTLTNGQEINVKIPAGEMIVTDFTTGGFSGTDVYVNDEHITGTVKAVIESGNQDPDPQTGILGTAVFTADEEGIIISWPNADLSNIDDCGVEFPGGVTLITVDGTEMYAYYPDVNVTANNTVEAKVLYRSVIDSNLSPYPFTNGEQITVTIPMEGVVVYRNYSDFFGSKIVYQNEQSITGTVNVIAGGEAKINIKPFEGEKLGSVADNEGWLLETTNGGYVNYVSRLAYAIADANGKFIMSNNSALVPDEDKAENFTMMNLQNKNMNGMSYVGFAQAFTTPGTYTIYICGSKVVGADGTETIIGTTLDEAITGKFTIIDPNAGWKFPSVTPVEGNIESIKEIRFPYAEGTGGVDQNPMLSLMAADGTEAAKFMFSDNFVGEVVGLIVGGEAFTTPGTYTLTIPGRTFFGYSNREPNAPMTYTWTIIDDTAGGGTQTETTLAFANETATVNAGETLQLTATSNVENAPIVYSSSDEKIATVDAQTGLVTAVAAGNVTITAYIAETDNYTEATAFCDVTVTAAQAFALVESYPAVDQKIKTLSGETFKFVFNEPVKRVNFTVVDNTTGEGVTMKMIDVAEASTTVEYYFDPTVGNQAIYALSPAHEYSVEWTAYYSYNSMMSNKKAGEGSIKIIGDDENAAIISPNVEFVSIDHDPDTFVFNDADGSIDHIDVKLTFQGEGIVNSVEAWVQAAQMDNRPQTATISEDGKTVTVTVSTADVAGSGACSLFVRAKDADGHIIGAPGEAVNPNNGYLQFSYASEIGLPAPTLVNAGQTVAQISELQFVNTAGISLNMDASGTWSQIQVVDKFGNVIETNFKEAQFVGTGGGNESYTTMTLTLSDPIIAGGQYAVVLPYAAFVLGQEQSATLNGSKTYTITVDGSLEPAEKTMLGDASFALASDGIIVSFPDAEIPANVAEGEVTLPGGITVSDGQNEYTVYPDNILLPAENGIEFFVSFDKLAFFGYKVKEGELTVTINGYEVVDYSDPDNFLGTVLETVDTPIEGTVVISTATGIDAVQRAIINGEKTYTISGQPVKTAKAGVYIINGKKVAVK